MITLRHTTVGRTPLDEWSARRRYLYLTTHNTHERYTSMPRRDSNPQSQHASCRRHTTRPVEWAVVSITRHKCQMKTRVNVIFCVALICYQSDQASDVPSVLELHPLLSPHMWQVPMHVVAARHVRHYIRQFNNTQFVLYTMDSESTPDRQLIQFPWMDWLMLTHSSPKYNLCLIKLQGHTD